MEKVKIAQKVPQLPNATWVKTFSWLPLTLKKALFFYFGFSWNLGL